MPLGGVNGFLAVESIIATDPRFTCILMVESIILFWNYTIINLPGRQKLATTPPAIPFVLTQDERDKQGLRLTPPLC